MGEAVCPGCNGEKRKGVFPCGICLGSGKVTDDPWWLNYYKKVAGVKDDGEQMALALDDPKPLKTKDDVKSAKKYFENVMKANFNG